MIEFLLHYKYVAFFIGMVIGGDIVLITGIYLAIRGNMSMPLVIFLAFTATIISDIFWYEIGKYIPRSNFIRSEFVKRRRELIDKLSVAFKKHSFRVVFYTKFVYGTRTIVQLLSGAHHLNFRKYISIDALGTMCYILLFVALGYTFKIGLDDLQRIVHNAQVTFAIFLAALFLINLWIQKRAKRYLFQ